MCDCIKNIETKMIGRIIKNKPVVKADFISGAFIEPDFKLVSTSIIEYKLEGQNKVNKQNIMHTYCPFCGEKYS